jgi:hypothetical protein
VLGGGRWSAPRPSRFTPGKDPVPIVQEAGWAPGPVWTGAENLAPTGIIKIKCITIFSASVFGLFQVSFNTIVWVFFFNLLYRRLYNSVSA